MTSKIYLKAESQSCFMDCRVCKNIKWKGAWSEKDRCSFQIKGHEISLKCESLMIELLNE